MYLEYISYSIDIYYFKTDKIIHILDGRKKENIGFFMPQVFKDEFEKAFVKITLISPEKHDC